MRRAKKEEIIRKLIEQEAVPTANNRNLRAVASDPEMQQILTDYEARQAAVPIYKMIDALRPLQVLDFQQASLEALADKHLHKTEAELETVRAEMTACRRQFYQEFTELTAEENEEDDADEDKALDLVEPQDPYDLPDPLELAARLSPFMLSYEYDTKGRAVLLHTQTGKCLNTIAPDAQHREEAERGAVYVLPNKIGRLICAHHQNRLDLTFLFPEMRAAGTLLILKTEDDEIVRTAALASRVRFEDLPCGFYRIYLQHGPANEVFLFALTTLTSSICSRLRAVTDRNSAREYRTRC